MSVIILENSRPEIAEAIYSVTQESYKQEASLLGLEHFPLLDKTANEITKDQGTYYGVFFTGSLAGVLHFNFGNIDSLVVRPCFQRLGVAEKLLSHLFAEAKGIEITVSTAELNMPATSLYQKVGFSLVNTSQKSGIRIVTYAKML